MDVAKGWVGIKLLLTVMVLVIIVVIVRQGIIVSAENNALKNQMHLHQGAEFIPFYHGKLWGFYSDPVFMSLDRVVFDQSHQPVIDASFRRMLKQAAAKLPLLMTQQQLGRLHFLIERQYPGQKGKVLGTWLISYYQYRQEKQTLLADRRVNRDRLDVFRALMRLREQYFGVANAKLLYEHQYQFANNLAFFERESF